MLQPTSENLALWKKMAFDICKDAYLADDLVSEMYIKLSGYDKPLNNHYIYFTIKHLHINWLREEKRSNCTELTDNLTHFEEDSEQPSHIMPPCLSWVERQILILRQQYSGRDIAAKYHMNYQKVHRIENEAKRKAKEWVISQGQEMLSQQ